MGYKAASTGLRLFLQDISSVKFGWLNSSFSRHENLCVRGKHLLVCPHIITQLLC